MTWHGTQSAAGSAGGGWDDTPGGGLLGSKVIYKFYVIVANRLSLFM